MSDCNTPAPNVDGIYPLAKEGVFWTIQGEGAMRGTPMVFIRLAGCSIGCPECDTDYKVAERVSVEEILARVRSVQLRGERGPYWVWITGGEPTDHDLRPLVSGLRSMQCAVALATAGTRTTQGLDVSFLSVSPHSMVDWKQRQGTELKVVAELNTFYGTALVDLVKMSRFEHYFVQPIWRGTEEDAFSLKKCRDYVLAHPEWRLTDQGHKRWGLK